MRRTAVMWRRDSGRRVCCVIVSEQDHPDKTLLALLWVLLGSLRALNLLRLSFREKFASAPPAFKQMRKVCGFFNCGSSYAVKPAYCRCECDRDARSSGPEWEWAFWPELWPVLSVVRRSFLFRCPGNCQLYRRDCSDFSSQEEGESERLRPDTPAAKYL